MFIVNQDRDEIVPLFRACLETNEPPEKSYILHAASTNVASGIVAIYDTPEEATYQFSVMLNSLGKDAKWFHFPPQRPTSPSEPSNP